MSIESFAKLSEERKQRILNAALEEFAAKGYDDASTAEIAKKAGISKGLLFHYFTSKRDLLTYLTDYVINAMRTEYHDLVNTHERDIFERLQQNCLVKLELLHKHPRLFDFGKVIIGSAFDQIRKAVEQSFEGVDLSRFREDIDPKKATKIIAWAVAGFINEIVEEVRDLQRHEIEYDGILAEFDAYIATLRECFYR